MPRFMESRTWQLLRNVPTQCYRLVSEVLSLRQKIVLARQSIHFLKRCLRHRLIPKFIAKKGLRDLFGGPEENKNLLQVELQLLRLALRSRRDHMYSMLKKCLEKEQCCGRLLDDRLWRRIVGGSKSICDSVRSNVKTTLQRKFDDLLSSSRNSIGRFSRTVTNQVSVGPADDIEGASGQSETRVTVLGNFPLPDCARSVLELGPSFSPSQHISSNTMRKVICSLHELQDRLRYKAKADSSGSPTILSTSAPNIPFPQTYFKQQEPDLASDTTFRIFADEVFKVFSRYQKRHLPSNLSREQIHGIRQLQELVKSRTIRLSVSDKGGEFVVIPRQLDHEITERHLEDHSLYRPSSEREFQSQFRRLNREWVAVAKSAGLDSNTIKRLKLESPSCPVLYLLIKTHKFSPTDDLTSVSAHSVKVRPIVSSVGVPLTGSRGS